MLVIGSIFILKGKSRHGIIEALNYREKPTEMKAWRYNMAKRMEKLPEKEKKIMQSN